MFNGKLIVKVPPNTSKTYGVCGAIINNLKLSDRTFTCSTRKYTGYRDIQSSNDIPRIETSVMDLNCKSFPFNFNRSC